MGRVPTLVYEESSTRAISAAAKSIQRVLVEIRSLPLDNSRIMKPFSEACEQNKDPILSVLRDVVADARHILEIGSGTGQHAVYFAEQLPRLTWQTSDQRQCHTGIHAWLADSGLSNVLPPLALNVDDAPWPIESTDFVFSANTAHIMHWSSVVSMFAGVGRILAPGGCFALYGPFNYNGAFTSDSNARFDAYFLKARDPGSGIRDFEAVDELAKGNGLSLVCDYDMPVNNRTLVWRKSSSASEK